jgi:hypothetical protein
VGLKILKHLLLRYFFVQNSVLKRKRRLLSRKLNKKMRHNCNELWNNRRTYNRLQKQRDRKAKATAKGQRELKKGQL